MTEKINSKYSVLVPTYNERENIEPFISLVMKEANE